MGTDFVTVLECAPGKRAAKLYTDPWQAPEDYDAGWSYDAYTIPVASLKDVAELIESLRHEPRAMIIRGRLRDGVSPQGVNRRCRDRADGPGSFEPADHHWVMVDVDKTSAPYDAKDPRGSVERWRTSLPDGLREAEMLFQFSAGAHRSETLRGHALFWLDAPVGDVQLRAWASARGFDRAVYTPVQPHYVADPIFEGCADVMNGSRAPMLFAGKPASARDILTFQAGASVNASATRPVVVGDVDQSPRFARAKASILEILGDPADHPDRKWLMCGALGGLLCKAGWPAANTVDLLETWLDVGDPAIDVEHGVNWALGAYTLDDPSKAAGVKPLAELISPDIADALRVQAERGSGRAASLTAGQLANWLARAEATQARFVAPAPLSPGERPAWLTPELDFSADPPPPNWLCEGLEIEAGAKTSQLAGFPNGGKGPFSNLFTISVALGLPFLGRFPVRQGGVLVLDWETGDRRSISRIRRMCRSLDVDPAELSGKLHFHSMFGGVPVDILEWLRGFIPSQDIRLIVIDSYTSAMMREGKESNTQEYACFMADLGDVAREHDVTVMPIVHARKGERRGAAARRRPDLEDVSGSSSLTAYAQAVIMLWRPDPDTKNVVEVSCARSVENGFKAFCVKWDDEPAPGGLGAKVTDPKWGLKATILDVEEAKSAQPAGLKTANDAKKAERIAEDLRCRQEMLGLLAKRNHTETELIRYACAGNRRAFDRVLRDLRAEKVADSNGETVYLMSTQPTPFQRFNNRAKK